MSFIRAVLRFIDTCTSVAVENCLAIVVKRLRDACEIWVRCNSLEDFLANIEYALNKGLVLLEISFLTGLRLKGYAINKEYIVVHGTSDSEVSGEIVFEYHITPQTWIQRLEFKKLRIDLEKKIAVAHLANSVSASQLFDLGIRLLKPRRIPP